MSQKKIIEEEDMKKKKKQKKISTAELILNTMFFSAVNEESAALIACVQIPPKFPWNFPLQRGSRALVKMAIDFMLILVYLLQWRYIC